MGHPSLDKVFKYPLGDAYGLIPVVGLTREEIQHLQAMSPTLSRPSSCNHADHRKFRTGEILALVDGESGIFECTRQNIDVFARMVASNIMLAG
jgi:hypothetical protein